MSSFVEFSEVIDSKLLPCSCSASWKLHSIAIKVMWSSGEERKEHFKTILMWLESPALLLSPLSVGVPITRVSGTTFTAFFSWCSFRLTMKMMGTMIKPRLGGRYQTKGHALTVAGGGNSRYYCCVSVKTSQGEKMESHPTYCDILTLDVTESIAHGNNLLIWILTPSRKGGFMRNLHTGNSWRVYRAELLPGAPGFALLVHLVIEGSVGTRSADTCTDIRLGHVTPGHLEMDLVLHVQFTYRCLKVPGLCCRL